MKIYLAGSFDAKDKIQKVSEMLKKEGHSITVEWWKKDFKKIDVPDAEWYNLPQIKEVRIRNFNGIDEADALILVSSDIKKKYNGANIEIGYAIGKGKYVIIFGTVERSAMYHGCMMFATIEGLINRLKRLDLEWDESNKSNVNFYEEKAGRLFYG